MDIQILVIVLLGLVVALLLYTTFKFFTGFRALKKKYAPVIDIEEEVQRIKNEATQLEQNTKQLQDTYQEKRKVLTDLETQVAIYDEQVSFAEFGVYEPHFDFGDSEEYKENIRKVRELQKDLVRDKEAYDAPNTWTVDGSLSKGKTMINRQGRLTLRAFNSECTAAIGSARWNNVNAMERRILNAREQIDKANTSIQLVLNKKYVDLKLVELYLTHEYKEKQKAEREERTELARAEREEKKLQAEAKQTEKEERRYEELLQKARNEVNIDEKRIAELEAALAEAHEKNERAQSMAEITKSGFVYVISNIGSFGEEVVKIGLTRRVNPDDRIRELGDASVPFKFDTHAMIYSEDAPALEGALHKEFEEQRVNAANMRKEFFNVKIDDVRSAVKRLEPNANFTNDFEAQEWHETLAIRAQTLETMEKVSDRFPAEI